VNVFVQSAGFLTSVQDLGRAGFRRSGVSVGGALDAHAMRVANALVGNEDNAAGLEATLGKLRLRFEDQRVVAWCGGAFTVRIDDDDLPPGHAGLITKGQELIMAAPNAGSRAWLAISGGIDVPLVLGSRSTDLRGNFGGHEGRTLRDGDTLPLGEPAISPARVAEMFGDRRIAEWTASSVWITTAPRDRFLRILRGPDWARFTPAAHTALVGEPFTVTLDSDRMGARLDGPNLERVDASDLLSEAVTPGTLQVPPNGKPILLLGDCQTIGGYPKIAHVITVDLPIAAQLWSGDLVRFHEVSLAEAQQLLREREDDFARFRVGLSLQRS
jgi:antagonist of KipI